MNVKMILAALASVLALGAEAKDIYLLLGQSNMAGRGDLTQYNRLSTDRVEKLDKADRWGAATEPIHYDKPSAGAGLGMSFARLVADATGAEIGLVPCAVGGSALNEWLPGAHLYVEAMRRAKIAQKEGEIKAILWHQGESDADIGKLEASYNERLAKMVAAMRAELGLDAKKAPFVYGAIGEFPVVQYYKGNKSLNAVMRKAVDAIPNAHWIEAADLTSNSDGIHFDTRSLRILGERYAKAYLATRGAAYLRLRDAYGDRMVFQRDQPVVLAGEATPGAAVTAEMDGAKATAKADATGAWLIELPAKKAGGPYTVRVTSGSAAVTLSDVLVGELWLCGGQSNMEMPVWGGNQYYRLLDGEAVAAAADDPGLRLLGVSRMVAPDGPRLTIGGARWGRGDDPEAVKPFSACGYHFGKFLRKRLGVPVGLVGSNWGGSRIEPWIPEKALRDAKKDRAVMDLEYARDFRYVKDGERIVPKALAGMMKTLKDWIAKVEATDGSLSAEAKKAWMNTKLDESKWKPALMRVEKPAFVWFRLHLAVDEDSADIKPDEGGEDVSLDGADEIRLPAGVTDLAFVSASATDVDEAWFDGKKIGETPIEEKCYWSAPRSYPIGAPKPGRHVLAIRLENHFGPGGFNAPRLVWKGGGLDLNGLKVMTRVETAPNAQTGLRPPSPWGVSFALNDPRGANIVPGTLFNAMIAPFETFRFRGAIWYQGCSNAGEWKEYDSYQRALVAGWRETFRRPDMAFLCVELAGYKAHHPEQPFTDAEIASWPPVEDGFVAIRAEQEKIREVPGCDCASAVDIGHAYDIHPKDKQEVARRLEALAGVLCYGSKAKARGPQAIKAVKSGDAVEIIFDEPLEVKGGQFSPHEFTLAGKDGKRVWASAKLVKPDTVRVESAAVKEPDAVDYGRAPYLPKMSVFNAEGFPATPFRLAVK